MTLTDEFLAAARAAVPAIIVYDADRPETEAAPAIAKQYAVLSANPGSVAALALCGTSDSAIIEFDVLSVGQNRSQVEAIMVAIRDVLMDKQFTSGDWIATVIEHDSQRVQRDPDIPGRVVLYGTDQYRAQASRA